LKETGKPPEFDSLLVFYITFVKVLHDRCIMQMMPLKPKFWKWIAPFAGIGLFISTVITSG
jgi:hypothetical protein